MELTPPKYTLKISSEDFEEELKEVIQKVKEFAEKEENWINVLEEEKKPKESEERLGRQPERIFEIHSNGIKLRFIYSLDYDDEEKVLHLSCSTSRPILLKPEDVESIVAKIFRIEDNKPMLISHVHQRGILHLFRKIRE